MSKRRVFDIDFDEQQANVAAEPEAETRRGPMAAAISENATALEERQKAEAAIRAENDRLAHEYVALRKNGQIVGLIDVAEIRSEKLIRDRSAGPDPELEELKASVRAVGLSNPIHVEEVAGGYELIQGFRRLSAYRELLAETGDARFSRIPATLLARGAQIEQLYRRMVDENLVRRDISFAEMAQLALSYSDATERGPDGVSEAVDLLFASAGRQKRSYIRHFTQLLAQIGTSLNFPEAIPRATGLALVRALEADPRLAPRIRTVLDSRPERDASGELAVLRAAATAPAVKTRAASAPAPKSSARTTIKLNRASGVAKCTASAGRFEVTLEHDVGAVDPRRLEAAARAFLDVLKL